MCHARKGDSGSKLAPSHHSDVAHSAFHPRRRVHLSQGKLTGAINVTKAKQIHVQSNTDGAYREELRSDGLGNFRAKPTSCRTEELDVGVSGNHAVKKCCCFRKMVGRHSNTKNMIVDEKDFEQFFREPGSKWRISSPSKWDSQGSDHTWIWNGAPEMSSFYRQDIQSLKETMEKGQQDAMTLASQQQETQNEVPKTSMELAMPEFKQDDCLQELQDLEGELDLKQYNKLRQKNAQIAAFTQERDNLRAHPRQPGSSLSFREHQDLDKKLRNTKDDLLTEQRHTRFQIKQLQHQLEESGARLEQRTAKITQLLEKNGGLESQVRELKRILKVERAAPNSNNSICVHELLSRLTECDLKVSALEKILLEKDMEQLRLREIVMTLRAEKEAQLSAMETLRKEHARQLTLNTVEKQWEQVPNALDLENQKWEADSKEQLQQHGLSLEEVNGRALKQAIEDLEKERRNSLTLQHKLVELQKRIQELEVHSHSLQQKTDQAISNLKTQMTEEKEKEIQQLREEMQLGKEKEIERLTSKMEEELQILRAKNSEVSLKEREARMQEEQAEKSFVSEIKTECERIRVLIQSTQMQALGRVISPPCSKLRSLTRMTLGEAIHALCRASEDLCQHVVDLRQELESQRCMVYHLQTGKDDTKEVSKLQRSPLTKSGREKEHTLQERKNELPEIQRTMAERDDVTACKPTHKFEEKQNIKIVYRDRSECQKTEMQENEIHPLPLEHTEPSPSWSASTTSVTSSAVISCRQKDFGTLKLLKHLQSRVKQLRAENNIYCGTSLNDVSILHTTTDSSCTETMSSSLSRSMQLQDWQRNSDRQEV
ncbi:calponin homology domain-containing protein DDB_G0272472 [Rhincodon typus]|uniref:calponin homology domain-containing protein DDB_G0272472 n=1 Tax=Rhincodon typus TaxID=259920 RepID=UPI00202F0F7E|nr:calponin homology domain-containing protein DDB_G0272472 [Rhincodon typus]